MINTEDQDSTVKLNDLASSLFSNSSDYLNSRLSLAASEAKLAFSSGVAVVALGVGIAVLAISLWTLILFTIAYSIVSAGLLSLLFSFILVIVLNLLMIVGLTLMLVNFSKNISFKRTLEFDRKLALLEKKMEVSNV